MRPRGKRLLPVLVLVLVLVLAACAQHAAAPPTEAAPAWARCGKPGWHHDPTIARMDGPRTAVPPIETVTAKLFAPSRWDRAEALEELDARLDAPQLAPLLDRITAVEASSYLRSEAARLRLALRDPTGRGRSAGILGSRSYAGAWDTRPEPLAAIAAPVRQRAADPPGGYFEAFATSACFRFPADAEATLASCLGTVVGASGGEFGCLAALYQPGQAPRALPLCGTVFFDIGKMVYGIYRLDHMMGLYQLNRLVRRPDGELVVGRLGLPDAPRGAYALADGTLLIDTGEAAVHVDLEGIASVRPRDQVPGLPAGKTEGFEGMR